MLVVLSANLYLKRKQVVHKASGESCHRDFDSRTFIDLNATHKVGLTSACEPIQVCSFLFHLSLVLDSLLVLLVNNVKEHFLCLCISNLKDEDTV